MSYRKFAIDPLLHSLIVFHDWIGDWHDLIAYAHRNGHGCMLQYALLHLFGYKVSIDDLKAFRVGSVASYDGSSTHYMI